MAHSMRGNVLSDAGELGVFFDDALNRARGDATIIARGI